MSDKIRWRYGDANPVVAAVDFTTVIEIGDLVWQDVDDAKPASAKNFSRGVGETFDATSKERQQFFAEKFLGVAMERSRDGNTTPVRVATTGVFEFECSLQQWELGDLVSAIPNDTGRLQNQAVGRVDSSRYAIGRVTKREASPAASVLIDVRSTVMTGGVAGQQS